MFNLKRIICIWICCVSCMFGTTQLSSLVRAVPYEYFDDHEQSFYDLDTEQIQAKYDTRLLSQQMLQTEQQQQQQQQHLENLKGFHSFESGGGVANSKTKETGPSHISTAATKLKNNDARTLALRADSYDADADADAVDAGDGAEHNDWLEETATKAAASTTTIADTLDELHLPRAASCFTNGQTFTHGQKVPRLDNCEVCLCMDGEIFCWWEKCDKKATKASTTYDDYSTPFEESSTTRMQLNPKATYKTTLKPMKKPKINEDYKYDDDDSAEIREMQQEYEGIKKQFRRKEHEHEHELEHEQEHHKVHHNKQMVKKKLYQQQQHQQEEEKLNNKKKNEENKNKNKNNNKKQQEQQHSSHKQHKTNEQHHAYNHNNNRNNNHDYGSNGSSNKILNFPENLPSVLYYDYKTEEHHQHQHQHREQHLKHQRQKQQQHEKQLKQQQQQQLKEQKHVNRHNKYAEDLNAYSVSTLSAVAGSGGVEGEGEGTATARKDVENTNMYSRSEGSSTTFKYYGNGNENIYSESLQTDSDILPEPPTNKPKLLTSITNAMATAKTTEIPITQLYRWSTMMMGTTTTTTSALTNTSPAASISLKKRIFSPWDSNKLNNNNNDDNNSKNNKGNANNKNSERSKDTIDTDDQDDAFHRWLTSTETNNKNNFTLNDAIIGSNDGVDDENDEDGLAAVVVGGSALDASTDDYNVNEKNYENINWEIDTGLASLNIKTKTKATTRPPTMKAMATLTTTINASYNTAEERNEGGAIYYENMNKPKYELNFSENSSNTLTYSNGVNSNRTNLQFTSLNPYRNNNNNNRNSNIIMNKPTSSSEGVTSSTTSNEDNGVASVVNIDIMLTASSAESQKQQQPQQTNPETLNQQRQLQLQLQDYEHENQIAKTQQKKFMQPPVFISNTNAADNNNNPLYAIINDNTRNFNTSGNSKNITNFVGDGLNMKERTRQLQNVRFNLSTSSSSSSNNNNFTNNDSSGQSLSSGSDSFQFSHISAVVTPLNATSAALATQPSLSTTLSPERQCNVMGTLYKIGDILPQDTGNCLQCICIDGSTSDDTPRVTCSPHNCPPLVLPDLFDATGY